MSVLRVDRLRLHLPARMRADAPAFARELVRALSRLTPSGPARVGALEIGPVTSNARGGVRATATAVVEALQEALDGGRVARRL